MAGGRVNTAYMRAMEHRRKRNPVPESSAMRGRKEQVKRAARLYEDFTGEKAQTIELVDLPRPPKVGLVIGRITGIMYETVRDGAHEDYIHEFGSKSRPTFVVSHDGKQLIMLGGAYNFTARGIIDKR